VCNVKATSNSARPFPRTGEIAIFANFTKSPSSFPSFFLCLFNLLRMVRLLHLELLAASPAEVHRIKERVMAKVIEFYVPKNFRNAFVPAGQPQPGTVIEFSSQAKESVPTRPDGGVLGWLQAATESNHAVGSESSSPPGVA
jgi:hypothetical protein